LRLDGETIALRGGRPGGGPERPDAAAALALDTSVIRSTGSLLRSATVRIASGDGPS
jgi:hypothetical protein